MAQSLALLLALSLFFTLAVAAEKNVKEGEESMGHLKDDVENYTAYEELESNVDEDDDEVETPQLPLGALTEVNLYDVLDENDNVAIFFTTPNNCAECKLSEKMLEDVYNNNRLPHVSFHKIDCYEELPLCRKYGVSSYPALKLFSEGTAIFDYKDHFQSPSSVHHFLEKYSGPKVLHIKPSEIEGHLKDSKRSVVLGFFDSDTAKEAGSFSRTAAQLFPRGYLFLQVTLPTSEESQLDESEQKYVVQYEGSPRAVYVFKPEKSFPYIYKGKVSRKRLVDWISEVAPLWVMEATSGWQEFLEYNLPILTVFIDYEKEEEMKAIVSDLHEAVEPFKNKILFTYMNSHENQGAIARVGVDYAAKGSVPLFILYDLQAKLIYPGYDEEDESRTPYPATKQRIIEFLTDYQNGQLFPFRKKQKGRTPEEEQNEVVKTYVYEDFRVRVMNPKKDVAVLFYLPNSDACKSIQIIWKAIGQALADVDNIEIAQIDMDANESAPGFPVWNFPTIALFNVDAKRNEKIFYGDRSYEYLLHWLQSNASIKFTIDEKALEEGRKHIKDTATFQDPPLPKHPSDEVELEDLVVLQEGDSL